MTSRRHPPLAHPDRLSHYAARIEIGRVAHVDNDATAKRPDEPADAFSHSGLAALFAAAALEAPDTVLLRDDAGFATARDAAVLIGKIAAEYRRAGLQPGERILIAVGAQISSLVALAAALAIGAEPALAPCGLSPLDLAAHARVAKAAALVGPSIYGTFDCGDSYLSAAALVDTIRLVATLGPAPLDGAIDLSPQTLAMRPDSPTFDPQSAETPLIATFQRGGGAPELVLHRQAALFADALSLVEKARINPSKGLLTTIPPATLAGLVAGPFAAMVGASGLSMHGPFDARAFLRACDREHGSHLVLPTSVAAAFAQTDGDTPSSIILISRYADAQAFSLPETLNIDRPLVDLYAFGEETILLRRRVDGEALAPSRVTDKSVGGGLGARLNRARADARAGERS